MRAVVRAGTCLAAALLATSVPQIATAATPEPPEMHTVTLISGDRLLIAPDGSSATRMPDSGRADVPLISRFAGGHLEVVPADALPLLAGDRLDPRLFDVTELTADGYDKAPLGVIITYDKIDPAASVRTAVPDAQVRDLQTLKTLTVRVAPPTTAEIWRRLTAPAGSPDYRKVWLDGLARPMIDVSVPLVGAPAAWAAGYTGNAVGVGVLDSGIDAGHPDLAGSVAASADFTGTGDTDRDGHGTVVASIIAGSGAASDGRYRGMAPDARLYSAKVCNAGACPESAVLAGMQWAARDQNLKVVTMSLGQRDDPGSDLLEQAVDTLTAQFGTLFVVAAGNDGPVTSPASAPDALAVGATTIDDQVADFTAAPAGLDKPDIAAPGAGIVAARSSASGLARTGPGGRYTELSGTSMAAPHVAGAAAMLAQEHPDWTAAQLKADLMNAATAIDSDRAGAGRLDIAKAVVAAVEASPASLWFGHEGGTATVTYRNVGPAAVTLDLRPGSGLTVDDSQVTVPARGEAPVVVEAHPGRDGRIAGVLTASGGTESLRTPYSVDRAVATHRLTVNSLWGGVSGPGGWVPIGAGPVDLPDGAYTLAGSDGRTLVEQQLTLDHDLTVDPPPGTPIVIAPPAPEATQVWTQVAARLPSGAITTVQSSGPLSTAGDGAWTAASTWVAPGAVYSLAWPKLAPLLRAGPLATVHADYRGTGVAYQPYVFPGGVAAGYASTVGGARTEYFSTGGGVRWAPQFGAAAGPWAVPGGDTTWGGPVSGPAFPPPNDWHNEISRSGDRLRINPSWFSDGSGEHGGPSTATHRLVVARDGVVLSDTATPAVELSVPAETGTFTITDDSTRSAATSVSTRTVWTFRSGHIGAATPLPLAAIRFQPRAAGVLAFGVQRQPGSAFGATSQFTLQVSYDDGKTWRSPLFSRLGEHGVALLKPGAAAVSVKAVAADAAGDRVEETIVRAYLLPGGPS